MNKDTYKLTKNEIIRGNDAFQKIYESSVSIDTKFIKVFINNDFDTESPQNTNKVGFVVSKKKFGKAAVRNRLKRIMREVYRHQKNTITIKNFNIIFSLNNTAAKNKNELLESGYTLLTNEFERAAEILNNKFKRQNNI